ncbi:adenylosuccinate synthetase [Candidatus Nomurabacteria bacterium]|uniref:Adenylosuccinate synthetase n=1 Tax=Candidatus Dojkabacteria bacterium TaxID=2099670 RepID=A0A955I1U1_9BACT|nr:adenylosuccinate synthetase [Candidatus Dojkabacteria bacterium]MCB9790028.1 adenylosuccinate synthetase [Candidatus Nomurabacteria bacterium]MCB9803385.1 adenylosuccinate synthetase [Candidatus Nomurabacteria bacterium]
MFHKSSYFGSILNKVTPSQSLVDKAPVISRSDRQMIAVIGAQLGDEGKGRIIDNKLNNLSSEHDEFYVIRSQGGSNAGHTVQIGDRRIGLHQIPSAVFHQEAKLILDFGMVIHPEDLLVEIDLVEQMGTSLADRIFLSQDAMLCTDVERAKEVLNRVINGKAKGGTGRGMSPTTAMRYEKLGLVIQDLVSENWREILTKHYQRFDKLFTVYGEELSETEVPDFKRTKATGKSHDRKVGRLEDYLDRLENVRENLTSKKIVVDTFALDRAIYMETTPVLFEMAQAVGLSPAFGTRPDTTSTETSSIGITLGTRVFPVSEISERIGVMKATYMSSVGARVMPTNLEDDWAEWVREFAHEYGTTTGRPRDICAIDLPFLDYNVHVGGINQLAMTHLDVSRKNDKIRVCIGYKRDGEEVYYKPDLDYLKGLEPIYVELQGWDSDECSSAKDFESLPNEAKKYVNFIESAIGVPVTMLTTGPDRHSLIER